MAILTTSGRTAIAIAVAAQSLHFAWGIGNPAWDGQPPDAWEPVGDETALENEVGRRARDVLKYCKPDPAGDIILPEGRFKESLTPTNYLYVRVNFDYTDAPASEIREVGVFVGTDVKDDLPPGQTYFLPADLDGPGTLYALQRIPKITRSSATRQSFETVLEF